MTLRDQVRPTGRVAVVLEHRFDRTPDGSVWTGNAFARPFWDRYLTSFGAVRIVARVRDVPGAPKGQRVDGEAVTVHAVPHFVGPLAFVQRYREVRNAVQAGLRGADAVVLRTPGTLSNLAFPAARRAGTPYAVEVVGDPLDVFARKAVVHPARAFFRWWFAASLRRQAASADVAAYVTRYALQQRYPPGKGTWSTYYSDVQLGEGAVVAAPPEPRRSPPYTLVNVASLDQPYKAVDVQLQAIQQLRLAGVDAHLRVVGDGRLRPDLEALAHTLGVHEAVTFVGSLPGPEAVRAELDRADLFLLPSRTEGLPRALVEAMARGLPAIGSQVGGIPELLPASCLVPPDQPAALADRIATLLASPEVRQRMGATNWTHAQSFAEPVLAARREAAYQVLAQKASGCSGQTRAHERPS